MSELHERKQLEQRLRAELGDAERLLDNSTPEQKPAALERFTEALRAFSELILDGRAPRESRRA
jgi:hypothetical protein